MVGSSMLYIFEDLCDFAYKSHLRLFLCAFLINQVSCLSFLEPLTMQRKDELDKLSRRRQATSLPHRFHFQRNHHVRHDTIFDKCLVGFDDVVTFECKTLCLVGRCPFWTAFRCFLTHLHLLSGSSSDIPLERHISHLLLSVPLPKPGGQCVLIPMSTMREPMALVMPPLKDLPLLDLSYKMLFSALDVPTVVTIVLGFLCLEKKVPNLSSPSRRVFTFGLTHVV
jgi:hypothetical protein